MSESPRHAQGPLLLAGMLWGTSFVAGKVGVEGTDPYLFTALRSAVAALSLVPMLFLADFDRSLLRSKAVWGISFLNATGLLLQNVGLTYTTASNTVLLVDINVVIVAVLAALLLRERLDRRTVAGLVLGMAGVGLIATKGDPATLGGGSGLGDLLAFSAGVVWAFYIVLTTKELRKGHRLVPFTSAVIMLTAVLSVPVGLLMAEDRSVGTGGLALAVYLGLFCTTVAFMLYNWGLRALGATQTSIILLVEMVFGLGFSFLLLGERPDPMSALGGALILLAIAVISVRGPCSRQRGAA
ncbi:MAG: DMT family transporter [Methanomassiliicoccales archaeon]|nr:DMT family transporter [Methanomassiliicoccales archaeon]MCE5261616.1 DMT family transporter [Euryarchaeota archaeon]HOO03286.1 DMT family transporter [Methanomassiliicoccales archaeon]HRR66226.1 DMT family transporter [Methanomassiliicoccales archaeon]